MYNLSANTVSLVPLNALQIESWNEFVVFFVSLLANLLLIGILLAERSKTLRAYSKILLLNCCVDLLFTFAAFTMRFAFEECEMYDGLLIAILRGTILRNSAMFWHHLGMGFYMFAACFSMFIIPVVFYFRYCLVVKSRLLTHRQLLTATLIPVGGALTLCALDVLANTMNDGAIECAEALSHPVWTASKLGVDTCMIAKGNYLAVFVLVIAVMDVVMYSTMVYFTVKIYGALRRTRHHFSASTARLQRQMNVVLGTQLMMPVLTAGVPVVIFVLCTFFHLTIIGTGLIATFALAWLPLVNPLITILLVTNYRKRALRCLLWPLSLFLGKSTHFANILSSTSLPPAAINTTKTCATAPTRGSSVNYIR